MMKTWMSLLLTLSILALVVSCETANTIGPVTTDIVGASLITVTTQPYVLTDGSHVFDTLDNQGNGAAITDAGQAVNATVTANLIRTSVNDYERQPCVWILNPASTGTITSDVDGIEVAVDLFGTWVTEGSWISHYGSCLDAREGLRLTHTGNITALGETNWGAGITTNTNSLAEAVHITVYGNVTANAASAIYAGPGDSIIVHGTVNSTNANYADVYTNGGTVIIYGTILPTAKYGPSGGTVTLVKPYPGKRKGQHKEDWK